MTNTSPHQIADVSKDPFEEYFIQGEPERSEKAYAWQTAVGLQDVDKLRPSDYLLQTAKENIEGNISIDEARRRIESYYAASAHHSPERTEEADKVSVRIAEILSEKSFIFTPAQYISIHQRLFQGIYAHAGKIRDYNISKKEWVLNGASVIYGGAFELRAALDYDFQTEKKFSYAGLTMSDVIRHLAYFISRLWQIHIFGEGNTRTTAVFFIKYLRSLGFHATNDVFAKNAWYFRNSLVRANYSNVSMGIHEDSSYLELFLRNLLMGETHELRNRYLHISWDETALSAAKQHIEQHIEQHIAQNSSLLTRLEAGELSDRTRKNIIALYDIFGNERIFGRGDVMKVLGITERPASTLLNKMYEFQLTEQIRGAGKGKYRFIAQH